MTETITIAVAEGRRVRDPETGTALGEDAVTVTLTPFWQRRLDDADVVIDAKPASPRQDKPR